MTEQELVALQESNKTLAEQVKNLLPLVEQYKPLSEKVSALEKENVELKGRVSLTSQEVEFNSFKTAYPDVPESVLKALPVADRAVHAKVLQDKFAVKAPAKTDPMSLWADAGGIGPTTEAEEAALRIENNKKRNDAKERGDVYGVLKAKSSDILKHLRQSFAVR